MFKNNPELKDTMTKCLLAGAIAAGTIAINVMKIILDNKMGKSAQTYTPSGGATQPCTCGGHSEQCSTADNVKTAEVIPG